MFKYYHQKWKMLFYKKKIIKYVENVVKFALKICNNYFEVKQNK